MARAFLIVLDSVGIGHAPDAEAYGDKGADTLGHIAAYCEKGLGDRDTIRSGRLKLPNLQKLGLFDAARLAGGRAIVGEASDHVLYGAATEISMGKDTPSGHWEIAGVPVPFDWGYFPRRVPTFPEDLVSRIIAQAGLPGILGDRHASGTEIISELGEEHIRSGKPIFYTSADSVFQIAAHETHFGLERLYRLCELVRGEVDALNIGRVIARPFIGETADQFSRTANRKDYAVPPPEPTILDRIVAAGGKVHAVGKIGDIFAHRGITTLSKAPDNDAMFDALLDAMSVAEGGDLVFANFVDFDALYGHRRDVPGYAAALEAFDTRLPEAIGRLAPGDLLVITADHGCDPTWAGTDHTREMVPVLAIAPGLPGGAIGVRPTFADIAESIAQHLELAAGHHGHSFLKDGRPSA